MHADLHNMVTKPNFGARFGIEGGDKLPSFAVLVLGGSVSIARFCQRRFETIHLTSIRIGNRNAENERAEVLPPLFFSFASQQKRHFNGFDA
tara:strand:+ start:3579 stop:3854 length:276 start_codon:yes stop_codon:yes gene_type:complete